MNENKEKIVESEDLEPKTDPETIKYTPKMIKMMNTKTRNKNIFQLKKLNKRAQRQDFGLVMENIRGELNKRIKKDVLEKENDKVKV